MAAAVLAAAFLFAALPLPSQPLALPADSSRPTARGSFHIHTNRSDGSGSPDDVAAAAARAGLNFIIVTDHGDGTRKPDRAAVSCGRAGDRCRRAEHGSRPLHRDRARAGALSACAEKRATSSPTSGGSAGSASWRIRIRPSPHCAGATGTPTSTPWNGSMPTRNGATSGADSWCARSCGIRSGRPKRSHRCSIDRTPR